jgi:hypothetical protein
MGYEIGSIFVYDRKFWLFKGYSTNSEHRQTYSLHGLNGEVIEPLASECWHVLSPNEVDFERLEKEFLGGNK